MRLFNNLYAGAVALAAQEAMTKEELMQLDAQTDAAFTWNAVATAVADDAGEPVNGLKGNKFTITNNQTYAIVRNTSASQSTVTFHTQKTQSDSAGDDKDIENEIVVLPATTEQLIGPFSSNMYGVSGALLTVYMDSVETAPGDIEVALVYGI